MWAECLGQERKWSPSSQVDWEQKVETWICKNSQETWPWWLSARLLVHSLIQQVFSRPCVFLGTS